MIKIFLLKSVYVYLMEEDFLKFILNWRIIAL